MAQRFSESELRKKTIKELREEIKIAYPNLNLSKPFLDNPSESAKKDDWIRILMGNERRNLNYKNSSSRGRKSGSPNASARSNGNAIQSPEVAFGEQRRLAIQAMLSFVGSGAKYPIPSPGGGITVPCDMGYTSLETKEKKDYTFPISVTEIKSDTQIGIKFIDDFKLEGVTVPKGASGDAAINELSFQYWLATKKLAWTFEIGVNTIQGKCAIDFVSVFPEVKVPEVPVGVVPQGGVFPNQNAAQPPTAAAEQKTAAAPAILSGVIAEKKNEAQRIDGTTLQALSDNMDSKGVPDFSPNIKLPTINKLLGLFNQLNEDLAAALKAYGATPNTVNGANVMQATANIAFASSNILGAELNTSAGSP